ncbi:MAG: DUF177 domain-containing protein [Synergistaceae bacterium]|jgi:uncharacterized protein|nr:DUF177 domain-containing protein [Synergistaceae bacterium]
MKVYVEPPPEWDCGILSSRIRRNGELYEETFELPMNGSIDHWGQLYAPASPVTASVEANYAGERILIKVRVSARFSLPCSRCLKETGLAIVGDLRYLFTLRPARSEQTSVKGKKGEDGDSSGDDDGDVDVIPIDSFETEFDLKQYVWETLLLFLPERVLCSEDCRGLCQICGKDLNEGDCSCREEGGDPRFAVLGDIGAN